MHCLSRLKTNRDAIDGGGARALATYSHNEQQHTATDSSISNVCLSLVPSLGFGRCGIYFIGRRPQVPAEVFSGHSSYYRVSTRGCNEPTLLRGVWPNHHQWVGTSTTGTKKPEARHTRCPRFISPCKHIGSSRTPEHGQGVSSPATAQIACCRRPVVSISSTRSTATECTSDQGKFAKRYCQSPPTWASQ
jgi:hypothetical protein